MPRSTLDGLMVKVNCTSFLAVDVPGEGRKVLITPFGDLGDGSFLDPVGNQRLFIDHGKQVCTGAEALSGSEYRDSSGLRDDVDSAMNRYAANKLPNSVVTTYYKDVGGKSTVRTRPARPPPAATAAPRLSRGHRAGAFVCRSRAASAVVTSTCPTTGQVRPCPPFQTPVKRTCGVAGARL